MNRLVPAILMSAVCVTLAADGTGQFSPLVTSRDGKPIAGATILLERTDSGWSRKLAATNAQGRALAVGLEPKRFNITISAAGYAPMKVERKIPLAETLKETFVLLTPDDARLAATQGTAQTSSQAPDGKGLEESAAAFKNSLGLFNDNRYAEALPAIQQAQKLLQDACATLKDPAARTEGDAKLLTLERVYGISLVEVGKTDASKTALILQAEPFLVRAFDRKPEDAHVVASLLEVAGARHDAARVKQYQAALDALIGPTTGLTYNKAVAAFESGKQVEAKKLLVGIIASDPKFTDSHYLLGIVEYSLGNTDAARLAFKHYLQVAPTGAKASEVKEMLKSIK